jgi:hypothetical protein
LAGADSAGASQLGKILDLARTDGLGLVWLGPIYLGEGLVYLGQGSVELGQGHWLNRRPSGNLNCCVSGKLNCRQAG